MKGSAGAAKVGEADCLALRKEDRVACLMRRQAGMAKVGDGY